MPEHAAGRTRATYEDEISLLGLGSVLLRNRRLLGILAALGAVAGLLVAVIPSPRFVTRATIIPQEAEGGSTSDLAAAASQFGIRLPGSMEASGWGSPVYVELLRSPELLEAIAMDSFQVSPDAPRMAMMDLLEVSDESFAARRAKAVQKLQRQVISAEEDKSLRAVRLRVTTEWPALSFAVANRLIDGVNRFNLAARKTQAAAERQFIEEQAAIAEANLREAESRLRAFLQGNRVISPASQTAFEHDRLQREVMLRQDLHSSWVKSREDARIREVRDTPVITVLEQPRLPAEPQPRRIGVKVVLGALGGLLLGMFVAVLSAVLTRARARPSGETEEFFELFEQVRPRFLKRKAAR